MDRAEPEELCLLEAGHHLEDLLLLGIREPGLEPDEVVRGAIAVLRPELDHRPRAKPGPRIAQADRSHRAAPQRLGPALGHHLDRHAALEVARLLAVARQELAARVR